MAMDWPAAVVLAVCEFGLELLLAWLRWLVDLRPPSLWSGQAGVLTLVAAWLAAIWALAPRGWPLRGLAVLGLLILMWPRPERAPAPDELVVELFDVGNGLAVLVGTRDEWLLYDTGPGDGQGGDALGLLLPSRLARLDRPAPDRLVLSHRHRSATGGVGSLPDALDDQRIYAPLESLGQPCLAGTTWTSGRYRFRFLHPTPGLPYLEGNSSCVLHVTGPGGSVLLVGRIDQQVERRLMADPDLRADVLVLSDGGHRRASSAAFLESLDLTLALASIARFDRYDRPHPEVRARLEHLGLDLIDSGRCGALRVSLRADRAPQVSSAVGRSRRFWHARSGCPR